MQGTIETKFDSQHIFRTLCSDYEIHDIKSSIIVNQVSRIHKPQKIRMNCDVGSHTDAGAGTITIDVQQIDDLPSIAVLIV